LIVTWLAIRSNRFASSPAKIESKGVWTNWTFFPSLAPTAWTTSMSYPVSLPSLPWKLNGL